MWLAAAPGAARMGARRLIVVLVIGPTADLPTGVRGIHRLDALNSVLDDGALPRIHDPAPPR
jgi:hypothetical protein